MKFIEYAVQSSAEIFAPAILLVECQEIASIQQIHGDKHCCLLQKKDGQQYVVYGNYRTVTNRFFYASTKKVGASSHDDPFIRPSIYVYHRLNQFECDSAYFDPLQVKAFLRAIIPEGDIPQLPEHTRELIDSV